MVLQRIFSPALSLQEALQYVPGLRQQHDRSAPQSPGSSHCRRSIGQLALRAMHSKELATKLPR